MAAARSRRVRIPLLGVVLAVACGLIGYSVFATVRAQNALVKQWDVDARGPVLVSADGRTLTFTGVPDPAWSPGDCFGDLTVKLVAAEQPTAVAVHFRLRSAPRTPGGPVGSCAESTGIGMELAHPLGTRELTDSQGHPLRTVFEASLPRPRDPALTDGGSGLCVAAPQSSPPPECPGPVTVDRRYRDDAHHVIWTLYQSLDAAAPDPATDPAAPAGGSVQYAVVNGAPAGCTSRAPVQAVVSWTGPGMAQRLVLDDQGPGTTPDQLCAQAFDEARTVR